MKLLFKTLYIPIALSGLLLAACSTVSPEPVNLQSVDNGSVCGVRAERFRALVTDQKVDNAGATVLKEFPLFHSNRFLNDLAAQITRSDNTAASEWVDQVITLSAHTRDLENDNVESQLQLSSDELQFLNDCASQQAANIDTRGKILTTAANDHREHYIQSRKWLGFYGLLRPVFSQRIDLLHQQEKAWFDEPEGYTASMHYRPTRAADILSSDDIRSWMLDSSASNALGLAQLSADQLDSLFHHHAPEFIVEKLNENDAIGSPVWRRDQLVIDTAKPTVYTLPSYTSFGGERLLQLNYMLWFPERKPTRIVDLYSGFLDGLIWRVTLDNKGQVLLYDSIHPCGCYHKYFIASDRVAPLLDPHSKEPANIFDVTSLNPNSAVQISLTGNEHFIVGLDNAGSSQLGGAFSQNGTTNYTFAPYTELMRLPYNDHHKSMFSNTGLVQGSERLERFTLWPTGILSVGAMRQWGTHATGFVEQQHFDDARLFDRYFELQAE